VSGFSIRGLSSWALSGNPGNAAITMGAIALFIAAIGKSGQFPLHTWVPDAMAGPTPVSSLLHSSTMVVAGVFLVARVYPVFFKGMDILGSGANFIVVIGGVTIVIAALLAFVQTDIKKVLAYSTVSQLGYMMMGLGAGAWLPAVFHIFTHAFFKALMFLGSGSVIHAMGGEQDIRKMGGLHKHMKITSITFFIGCLAIAGIPGFSGFFSKDEILAGTFAHSPILYSIALFAALLTAFYMFRLYFVTFTGTFRGTHDQEHHLHESPAAMTFPLIVLAILSIIGGYVGVPEVLGGHHELASYLSPLVKSAEHHLDHNTEYMLMGLSTILVVISISFAWMKFKICSEIYCGGPTIYKATDFLKSVAFFNERFSQP
jgi:NADH-quinone oxidoreductase subunit L